MSRRLTICFILIIILIPCVARASDWSVELDNKIGASTYEEKQSTIDSNSTAFYYEGDLALNYFKYEGIIGRVDFGMPVTAREQETWDVSGSEYQTNNMSYWGMESNIELGYAFPILKEKLSIAPIGAYGFSFTRFTRSNFNILNTIPITGTVDEDYWVQHIDMGGKLYYSVSDNLDIDMKGLFGFVVYDSSRNSTLGNIDGGGGYVVKTEANINYEIIKSLYVTGGIFFDMQYLKGGTSGRVIWPDNYLYTYGAKIDIKYAF